MKKELNWITGNLFRKWNVHIWRRRRRRWRRRLNPQQNPTMMKDVICCVQPMKRMNVPSNLRSPINLQVLEQVIWHFTRIVPGIQDVVQQMLTMIWNLFCICTKWEECVTFLDAFPTFLKWSEIKGLYQGMRWKLNENVLLLISFKYIYRDVFMSMDELSKQSTIYENIHQLIGYIPTCINLMEGVLDRVEGQLGWKEFKFCFKLATSQIVKYLFLFYS